MAVTLYTQPDCRYCDLARRQLEERGETFVEVDVTRAPQHTRDAVARLSGGELVVPVLVEADGEARVGFGGV